jgi:N-acetylmuramic acid 6-phosphate etherase
MSESSRKRAEEFLKISGQFKLGALVTEAAHPVTANLSEVAKQDIAAALGLFFDVDADVIRKYREFVASGRAGQIKETVLYSLKNGGRIFFTGCGATGRLSILLDSVWRDFWNCSSRRESALTCSNKIMSGLTSAATKSEAEDFENRTFSVMAGGDYALIKSVEGFEDFFTFGRKQIRDLGVRAGDVVFAITEGGETSFVIGTAWEGVDSGAKVYFVYNNPDEILCQHVERSREIIKDPRIEKINLTTGPMAIAGSTRMQATSIQLCVLLTILEMVVRDLVGTAFASAKLGRCAVRSSQRDDPAVVPELFLAKLEELHATLKSPEMLAQLAKLVELEESVYRAGHMVNYFADRFGIDVLTDTTERSPTFCTPPFRKADDTAAADSWAFLFLPQSETPAAWRHLLKREPRCIAWNVLEVRELLAAAEPLAKPGAGEDKLSQTLATIRKIRQAELMQFKIGLDGLDLRPPVKGDGAIGIVSGEFYPDQLEAAQKAGAKSALINFRSSRRQSAPSSKSEIGNRKSEIITVPVPETDFLLDGVTRVAVKLVMNALSTCTMVRLGRVMGNFMVWVVPSNLKLIDRATRYIAQLTGLTYEAANSLLFEVLEYVEPRMKSDQAYPPVVGLAVLRARHKLTNEEAEEQLMPHDIYA